MRVYVGVGSGRSLGETWASALGCMWELRLGEVWGRLECELSGICGSWVWGQSGGDLAFDCQVYVGVGSGGSLGESWA